MSSTGVPLRLLPVTVTIVRAPVVADRYGNTVRDWNNAHTYTSPAWMERQATVASGAGERIGDRDELFSAFRIVLPAGTQIDGRDRVVLDGRTYEVQGPPDVVLTPRGPHHIEAVLTWREG